MSEPRSIRWHGGENAIVHVAGEGWRLTVAGENAGTYPNLPEALEAFRALSEGTQKESRNEN